MPLSKQIKVYALDTGNFYSNAERNLHWHINEIKVDKRKTVDEIKDIESKFLKCDVAANDILKLGKEELDCLGMECLAKRYAELKRIVGIKNSAINKAKEKLLSLLSNKVETNVRSNGTHHMRVLDESTLGERNVIAVFDSYFTRTIGAKQDELCEDFMVITKFYDDVMKDLIYFGFMFKGEKYVYFTSSAGQIRTKKCVFVKESVWKKHQKSIMCGLTVEDINLKGGNNPNKHLAYLALANSATDVWEEFDIDRTIVIDDFGTEVYGTFDFIDDTTYSIERITDKAPIEHTDGAGMMLPNAFGKAQKNKMVRLPWVKGLLCVFDFKRFVEEKSGSHVIKDIYGVEHDIFKEDIQVIFTKSQFKMHKYYDSWERYKSLYKEHGCTAGMTNEEEDRIKYATINYQMLQSLTDIFDEDDIVDEHGRKLTKEEIDKKKDEVIRSIAQDSIDRLNNLCEIPVDSRGKEVNGEKRYENIMHVFGITPYNTNLTHFQKAIKMYPNLLNDKYAKEHIKSIKDSMVKKYRAGKLNVNGKYTFVVPDFYAACEHWFLGIENPDGLLDDGEVFCRLFSNNEKLDCLRSPHLYKEHPIRKNVAWHKDKRRGDVLEWFCTDAIYTSCKDLISRILQFDVDGDKLLVVSDDTIIGLAEKNMDGIVPLYYNMRKAESVQLTSESIYNGLNAAFTGGNIGIYSNNISKIWNSDVFVNGSKDEKKRAVDIVKLLCMENNYVIDYAKTLYKPERPKHINDEITAFTNELLPHFFKYAKDKSDKQVVDANDSFVNKLNDIIPNPRISLKKFGIGEIDCSMMMSNPDIEFNENDPLIQRYKDFDREYYFSIDAAVSSEDDQMSTDRFAKKVMKYNQMTNRIKRELSQFGYDEREVSDILVKYLYGKSNSKNKTVLWMCYGEYIVENLERFYKPQTKFVKCVDCGEWFEVGIFDSATERCVKCAKEHKRELARLRKKKQRENKCHATL